jgi:hypothetical protein
MKRSFFCSYEYDPMDPNPDDTHQEDNDYNGGESGDGW